MSHTLDFDRFWAELPAEDKPEAEPLKMTVLGEDYTLPHTLPAIVVLAHFRAEKRTTAEMFRAADAIFGRAALDKWAHAGWDVGKVCDVVNMAERLIMGESPEEILESLQPDPTGADEGEKKGSPADAST